MNRQEIIDAYLFLRENNHDIPDETLDFMKDVSLRQYDLVYGVPDAEGTDNIIISEEVCDSCVHDGNQPIFPGPCTGCSVGDEYLNFKVKI